MLGLVKRVEGEEWERPVGVLEVESVSIYKFRNNDKQGCAWCPCSVDCIHRMEMTKTWIAHTDLITLTLMSRARARKGADVGVVTPTRTDNHRHRRLFPARAREEESGKVG